jgi:eukaryotic-like serine/threonine-protein kinase
VSGNERVNSIVDAGPELGSLRLERVLGRGGHAVVYAARQLATERELAVKVVDLGDNPEQVSLRFAREVQATRRAEHPHVVKLFGFATTADGAPCLILELLQGKTLLAVLAERRRLPPAEALRTLLPLMGALALLHQAGVVHRDISPSNIYLAEEGERTVPKLLDFGIAKHTAGTQLTRTGAVAGTVEYMSPEQATDGDVGPHTDIWAVGVVLYRALSGQLPFSASTQAAVLVKIVNESPRPLQQGAPDLGPRLSAAIDKALARKPADRYPSMSELARALVLAAWAEDIALPDMPDPLGLADFPKWLAEAEHDRTRTMDHVVEVARAPVRGSRPLGRAAWLGALALGSGALMLGLMVRPLNQRAIRPAIAPASALGTTTNVPPAAPIETTQPAALSPPPLPEPVASVAPAKPSRLGKSMPSARFPVKPEATPAPSSRFPSELVDTRW